MEQYIVEGNISVKAVLLAQKRDIIKIIVDEKKKDRDTAFILRQEYPDRTKQPSSH